MSRLAADQGRDRSSLVVEAVERMVEHDTWFVAEVEKGLAEQELGQMVSHEEVGKRVEDRLIQRRRA